METRREDAESTEGISIMADVLFVVDKVSIGKIWDKSMSKTASEAFQAGVEKTLNGSGSKVVKTIGKDEQGFKVSLTIETMEIDKKNNLAQSVKGVIAALPEDKYVAGLTHSGKLPDPNPKKMEADVKFLCTDSGTKLGEKLKKEVK